jgi:tetrahydromethanopterin S-methyltransferase subunit G
VFGGLSDIRAVKKQVKEVVARLEESGAPNEEVAEAAKQLAEKLSTIEEQLSQVKSKSRQDPINFPPQLDNQLVTLYGYVAFADFQPTAGAYERLDDLEPEVDRLLGELAQVVDTDVAAFNEMVAELRPAAVTLPKRE